MKVLAEIGQRIQGYFSEMDRQAKENYYRQYESPEAVAAFRFHRGFCTKKGPLKPVSDSFMTVSGGGLGQVSYDSFVRCIECKGSERDGK